MRYKWFEVAYEGMNYEVCCDTDWSYEVTHVSPGRYEESILPVMSETVIEWMRRQCIEKAAHEKMMDEGGPMRIAA